MNLEIIPEKGIYIDKFFVIEGKYAYNSHKEQIDAARDYYNNSTESQIQINRMGAEYAITNHLHPDLNYREGGICLTVFLNDELIIRCGLTRIDEDEKKFRFWTAPASKTITAALASEAALTIKEFFFRNDVVDTLVMLLPVTDSSTTDNVDIIKAWCVRDQTAEKFDDFILFDTPYVKGAMAYQRRKSYFVGKYSKSTSF